MEYDCQEATDLSVTVLHESQVPFMLVSGGNHPEGKLLGGVLVFGALSCRTLPSWLDDELFFKVAAFHLQPNVIMVSRVTDNSILHIPVE